MVVKSGVVCGAQRRMCGLARDVEFAERIPQKLWRVHQQATRIQVSSFDSPSDESLDATIMRFGYGAQFEMDERKNKLEDQLVQFVKRNKESDTFVEKETKEEEDSTEVDVDHDRNVIKTPKKTLKNENKQSFWLKLGISLDFTGGGGAFVATLLKRGVAALRLRATSISVLIAVLDRVSCERLRG